MSIHKKIYVFHAIVWIAVLAMIVGLTYQVVAWFVHRWNFPGLP